jgi:type II secretory pathway pseudopilin PulG
MLELLLVLAIVGALSAIVLGFAGRAVEAGRVARAKTELAALSASLERYRLQFGDYPQTDDEARLVQSLLGRRGPTGAEIAARPLIDLASLSIEGGRDPVVDADARLVDPWGHPYCYVFKTPASGWSNPAFLLYSIGPDASDAPELSSGGFVDFTAPANIDNLYAGR